MPPNINPDKALLFRIVHRENLSWILENNGLYAKNEKVNPTYRNIGNSELIDKRARRAVEIAPGGVLNDYVPFYFTPYSIMMYNIKTGYGVPRQKNEDIVIFVSSLHKIDSLGLSYVFTNQHAYPTIAKYYNKLDNLQEIDWPLLQSKDFKHNPDDPGKKERYQAEALVWKHVPLDAILGICCYNETIEVALQEEMTEQNIDLKTVVRPGWYF